MRKIIYLFLISVWSAGFSPVCGQTTLIGAGSEWKYLDDGSNQGVAWRSSSFDDSSWSSGNAQLGYGDGDEATVLSYGGNPSNKYITYYFRKHFSLDNPNLSTNLELGLLRDDGAVVYLNGNEVVRSNMPSGTINYLTHASSTVGGSSESTFYDYTFPSSYLVNGDNVVAVEIHQRSKTSSDISFDMHLSYETTHYLRKAPYLLFIDDNTKAQIQWQLNSTHPCTISWGLDENYSLGSYVTTEYGNDHQHTYTIPDLSPNTKYYYRVEASSTEIITSSFVTNPPDTAQDVFFYVYGDTRSYPSAHNEVAHRIVMDFTDHPSNQSVIFSTGDLVSNGNQESYWDNQFFSPDYVYIQQMLSHLPYGAVMGNHEGQGILFGKYFPYTMFASSRYYYSADYGPVHFTVIDQFTDYSVGSEQYNWLVNDLASSTKAWKIILLHEPGWSAGGHGNNPDVQNIIQPLCLQYGVQFVISGHNHYYARAVVDGVMHITTGGGGAPLYPPDPSYPYIQVVDESHHFCKFSITGDALTVSVVRSDGSEIENFTVNLSLPPEADFIASDLDPHVDDTVQFTDLSSHSPTAWNWTFSPATVTFESGTTANSQNPQVSFDVPGDYTVSLEASNAYGSSTETKNAYIHVSASDYCMASGGGEEYISQVYMGDINNSSGADGYTFYNGMQTDLAPGTSYSISVSNGNIHPGDDLGIWIDWNGDFDFEDTGENVVCEVDGDAQGSFVVNVPPTANLGNTRMRIRIKRQGNDCGSPCGTTVYGEVEDYVLNIVDAYQMDLTVWLEGAFNGTQMNANVTGFIPLNQPFNVSPWNYPGTESLLSVPPDMVDWILVEIRDANTASEATPSTLVKRKAGLLRTDGKIVDLDGVSDLRMAFDYSQNVYIVLRQRNHLAIMSSGSPTLNEGIFSYDFTSGPEQVYGGVAGYQNLLPGVWGMASGDGNRDGLVNQQDVDKWKSDAGTSGYLDADFNLDSQTDNSDKNEHWIDNENKSSQVPQ